MGKIAEHGEFADHLADTIAPAIIEEAFEFNAGVAVATEVAGEHGAGFVAADDDGAARGAGEHVVYDAAGELVPGKQDDRSEHDPGEDDAGIVVAESTRDVAKYV